MNDRIKLAEAMGAKCVDGVWHWKGSTWDSLIFRPYEDANDCEALKRFLVPKYMDWLEITYRPEEVWIRCYPFSGEPYVNSAATEGKGVCELALKVIK